MHSGEVIVRGTKHSICFASDWITLLEQTPKLKLTVYTLSKFLVMSF